MRSKNSRWLVGGVVAVAILAGVSQFSGQAADPVSEFASVTIDLGVVVADAEKSVKFYVDVVGFTELKGFEVPPETAAGAGLTNNLPVKVRVLALGAGPGATKLKLIQMADATPKKNDTAFVESELGFRYITLAVADTTTILARCEKAGVKPLAKGPIGLPKGFPEGIFLSVVRDPDGNFVEFVGPKK